MGESCLGGHQAHWRQGLIELGGASSYYRLDALDSSKSTSCAFLTSLRMWGSFPVDTAKIAKVTAICMSDLIPMIIPPRGLTVYLCGVPLWSARVNVPRVLPCGF